MGKLLDLLKDMASFTAEELQLQTERQANKVRAAYRKGKAAPFDYEVRVNYYEVWVAGELVGYAYNLGTFRNAIIPAKAAYYAGLSM